MRNAWEGFQFDLGETADMLRDSVRGFAADRIAPRAEEIDRSNTFPRDLWRTGGLAARHSWKRNTAAPGSVISRIACDGSEPRFRLIVLYGAHSNIA